MKIKSINIVMEDGTVIVVDVKDQAIIDAKSVEKIASALEVSGAASKIKENLPGANG
ncbi:hypothetical protein AB3N59_18690 [Leptospira sp. WS92.C1]